MTNDTMSDPGRRDRATNTGPGAAGLIPWSIVALGTPSQPIERAIGLQSAVYRLIVRLADFRPPWRGAGTADAPSSASGPLEAGTHAEM